MSLDDYLREPSGWNLTPSPEPGLLLVHDNGTEAHIPYEAALPLIGILERMGDEGKRVAWQFRELLTHPDEDDED